MYCCTKGEWAAAAVGDLAKQMPVGSFSAGKGTSYNSSLRPKKRHQRQKRLCQQVMTTHKGCASLSVQLLAAHSNTLQNDMGLQSKTSRNDAALKR